MNIRIVLCSAAASLLISGAPTTVLAALVPDNLRCEQRANPLGIDAREPRLSWGFADPDRAARGLRQSACQILVATKAPLLQPGKADLWDTGRWATDQSVLVPYTGRPLDSGVECWWTVRVWDQDGAVSPWSKPARWTMGLLHPANWRAKWIGLDEKESSSALAGTQWIWFPEGEPARSAPVGTRWFRREFSLPADRAIKSAHWLLAADNSFQASVNGQPVGSGGNFKTATDLNVASHLHSGRNVLAVSVSNAGDSPNPAGLTGLLRVEFQQGEPVVIATDEQWKTTASEIAGWTQPAFDDHAWPAVKKLGPVGMAPWGEIAGPENRRLPARMLRHEFTVGKKVKRATTYMSGLGLSELYLNGAKVGDEVLSPGLTEYPKTVFYVTHDVTGRVKRGRNCLGVWLGNGRYFAPRLGSPTSTRTYGYPKLLLQLALEFSDGTTTNIVSDESWRLTTDGPIRANNEYDGEEYDARLEMPGWARAGFKDSAWQPARVVTAPGGRLAAQMIEPIRGMETVRPISVKEVKPGVFIFDLGQNMVGWCRLKVQGPRGTQVSLRHAETLKPDGTLYLDNIRDAKVTDIYTLKDGGPETYEPHFTYHGFRYVEVMGYPGKPSLDAITGVVVHDAVPKTGDFACSNELLNRIHRNVYWGVRGNYRSIPTDCPQRDERQGWLGDRSAECRGESYLFNIAPLYAKWLRDMADAQKDSGSVPDVCPSYWPLYSDNVTWPSSTVIVPGMLYEQAGDRRSIETHYPSMKKWITYMSGFITNDLMPRDTYGDWCVPPENPKLIHSQDPARKTKGEILGATYFYHDLMLMTRYATMLGKADDARHFAALAARLKSAFNAKYLDAARGQYDNGAQTTSVLPLAFGMVPEEHRQKVFNHLVDKIQNETKGHIGTGLVGGQWLMRTLSDNGRLDLAYTIARQTNYPSWGYMISKGATTIWELWNGDTADPAMNSGNHVMLVGDLIIWFYEYLAGIKPDPEQPAFKHILMQPHPVGDLKATWAQYQSPHGLIRSDWRIVKSQFLWNVVVPPNTTATVRVPFKGNDVVQEGGAPAGQAKGVKLVGREAGAVVYELGSGTYSFTAPWGKPATTTAGTGVTTASSFKPN